MSDDLRYRPIDEPRAGFLQRFALPPLLVFIAATFFAPWGFLLIAANAVALNGPFRNREIGFAAIALLIDFAAFVSFNVAVRAGAVERAPAQYALVAAMGLGLLFIAAAYVSQHRTAELRRYLLQQG